MAKGVLWAMAWMPCHCWLRSAIPLGSHSHEGYDDYDNTEL